MKLHIKYDINIACKVILQEQLDKLEMPYEITGLGEIEIKGKISPTNYKELELSLKKYGIGIIDNPKNAFIQKIKDTIVDMVYREDKLPNAKMSAYLADKLNHSYSYLSSLFSEVTYSSIENFIILRGGHNCGHQIFPIMDSAVPDSVKREVEMKVGLV